MRVLILGGTTEASAIARALAGDDRYDPVLSFAGRTKAPVPPPIPFRVGGFGGAAGLAAYIERERIAALIDATHPFAARMKAHAATVTIPRMAVLRPAWTSVPGDRWVAASTMAEASAALGPQPRRVFLTVGQQDLAPFAGPHHYVVRSVDTPDYAPAGAEIITARGPFDAAAETALLASRGIEILVTKNAGGAATAAKLAGGAGVGHHRRDGGQAAAARATLRAGRAGRARLAASGVPPRRVEPREPVRPFDAPRRRRAHQHQRAHVRVIARGGRQRGDAHGLVRAADGRGEGDLRGPGEQRAQHVERRA